MFSKWTGRAVAAGLMVAIGSTLAVAQTAPPTDRAPGKKHWVLVWSDEFNGPKGSGPDPSKWSIVTGGDGFGNDEMEYYTGRQENIHQEHGHLVITARKESYRGPDNVVQQYTSARIQSKGRFEPQYGRIEARMKLPSGRGLWPAFWAMGNDFDKIGWPNCGEMDIMENVGSEPAVVHGSLHGPGYSGDAPLTGTFALPKGKLVSNGYHLYAVEWEPNAVRFYVDRVLFETRTADDASGKPWAFDHPFFLLLNLAVGGDWPGPPDAHTSFPAKLLIDYVRVYRDASSSPDLVHPKP